MVRARQELEIIMTKQELIEQKEKELKELQQSAYLDKLGEIYCTLKTSFPNINFTIRPEDFTVEATLTPPKNCFNIPIVISLSFCLELFEDCEYDLRIYSDLTEEELYTSEKDLSEIIAELKDFYVEYSSTIQPTWYENDTEITDEEFSTTIEYYYYPFRNEITKISKQ